MKKMGKAILIIIAIVILIGIILKISNKEINKQEKNKQQQLTEATKDNAYVDMATHLSEIEEASSEDFYLIKNGDIKVDYEVLSGVTFTKNNEYSMSVEAYELSTSKPAIYLKNIDLTDYNYLNIQYQAAQANGNIVIGIDGMTANAYQTQTNIRDYTGTHTLWLGAYKRPCR